MLSARRALAKKVYFFQFSPGARAIGGGCSLVLSGIDFWQLPGRAWSARPRPKVRASEKVQHARLSCQILYDYVLSVQAIGRFAERGSGTVVTARGCHLTTAGGIDSKVTDDPESPMASILIAECIHEICSFNPVPTRYDDFSIQRGQAFFDYHRNLGSEVGGALKVLEAEPNIELRPTFGARGITSGGTIAGGRLRSAGRRIPRRDSPGGTVDGAYFALHGAMASTNEEDPEGYVSAETRKILGERHPHRRLVRLARHSHRPHARARRCDCRLSHVSAR